MTYKQLKVNVLLRLGEDDSITDDGSIEMTNSVTSYIKAIEPLLCEGLMNMTISGLSKINEAILEGQSRYDLYEIGDFYKVYSLFYGDDSSEYTMIANRYLVVDDENEAYTLYYYAVPNMEFIDDEEIDASVDVQEILPLYIEGKLRLIADEDYASLILNEYEEKKLLLMSKKSAATVTGGEIWSIL